MWHTDNRVQIEFREKLFLNCNFGIISSKKESIRQYYCRSAILLKSVHYDRHEKVSCFATCKIRREVVFDFCLLAAAVWWIC